MNLMVLLSFVRSSIGGQFFAQLRHLLRHQRAFSSQVELFGAVVLLLGAAFSFKSIFLHEFSLYVDHEPLQHGASQNAGFDAILPPRHRRKRRNTAEASSDPT